MTTHSSILACRIPGMEEPGGLPFIRSHRVGHSWSNLAAAAALETLRIFQFVVTHTVKGFSIVNEAEVDVLLEFSCFFYDPTDIGNLISGSSAFSKSSLNIWKFSVHILFKPGLENFAQNEWNECNCAVIWIFFGISLLWDWNENWLFPVLWPLLRFPNLLACWV